MSLFFSNGLKLLQAIASKLFYSCIAVYSSRGLGKFRELVESRQPSGIGSLVRSLQLHRFEREDPEEEPTRELWWWEMCRLVRLLPNLVVLRGGSNRIWGSGELQVLAELLSSPPRPFRAFENLQVDSNTLPLIISLLQYSSETLQYLSFTLSSGSAVVFPHHPSTYPLITFPSLTRISFRTAFTNHHLLLPIATSRWSFPVLRSVETTGSPSLSPFLRVHGSKVKELGFISQPFWDDNSYEECLDLCPNLETLGWLAWEPKRQNPHPVQLRPLDRAVVSVRRIEVGQHLGEENHRHDSFVNSTVPPAITKAAFPSLERVVFKTGFLSISKQ